MGTGGGFPDPHPSPANGGRQISGVRSGPQAGINAGGWHGRSYPGFSKDIFKAGWKGFALVGVGITHPQTPEQTLGLGAGGTRRES